MVGIAYKQPTISDSMVSLAIKIYNMAGDSKNHQDAN